MGLIMLFATSLLQRVLSSLWKPWRIPEWHHTRVPGTTSMLPSTTTWDLRRRQEAWWKARFWKRKGVMLYVGSKTTIPETVSTPLFHDNQGKDVPLKLAVTKERWQGLKIQPTRLCWATWDQVGMCGKFLVVHGMSPLQDVEVPDEMVEERDQRGRRQRGHVRKTQVWAKRAAGQK